MDVYEAIRSRRTLKQYQPDPIPRTTIERVLDVAVWAPNHHLTEPWRFIVLTGTAKDGLAELRRQQSAARFDDPSTAHAKGILDEAYRRMAGAAALIVVTCQDGATDELTDENRFATAAAIQNLLLAATAEGLASFWSSGIARYEPARAYLDVPPNEFIVSVVHLGYPGAVHAGRRTPAAQKTRWLDTPPVAEANEAATSNGAAGA